MTQTTSSGLTSAGASSLGCSASAASTLKGLTLASGSVRSRYSVTPSESYCTMILVPFLSSTVEGNQPGGSSYQTSTLSPTPGASILPLCVGFGALFSFFFSFTVVFLFVFIFLFGVSSSLNVVLLEIRSTSSSVPSSYLMRYHRLPLGRPFLGREDATTPAKYSGGSSKRTSSLVPTGISPASSGSGFSSRAGPSAFLFFFFFFFAFDPAFTSWHSATSLHTVSPLRRSATSVSPSS